MLKPMYSYMLSNRSPSDPDTQIGPVQFLRAPNVMARRYTSAGFSATSEDALVKSLARDLQVEPGSPSDLLFYIHGFATSEPFARLGFEQYGLALTGVGLDQGIVVGVSWPSNTWTYGGAQENARGSAALLAACSDVLTKVRMLLAPRVVRGTLLCHSMGNYLLAYNLAAGVRFAPVDTLCMLAADVDYAIWDPASPNYPQGKMIAQTARKTQVFFTQNDTVLYGSQWVNWDYRLGYAGAKNPTSLPPNVKQMDYSAQGNFNSCQNFVPYSYYSSVVGGGSLVHSSSKFDPDVLTFSRVLLQGGAPTSHLDATRDPAQLMAGASGQAPAEGSSEPAAT